MDGRSVFFDEWLNSLRQQYKYVVRHNDQVTLPSLTAVMQTVGFTDDELAQLRVEATIRVDAVGDDFVPDLQILEQARSAAAHPAECLCPQCVTIDERAFDDEGKPIAIDPEQTDQEAGHVFPAPTLASITERDETESITFEDSLTVDDSETAAPESFEDQDQDKGDPDEPQQISLF